MKTLRLGVFLGVVCALLLQVGPQAVGTLTISTTTLPDVRAVKYSLAWLSDASGAVSANPATFTGGILIQVKFVPDAGGTAPTTLYDVTLVDTDGVDYLAGAGANLSATVSTVVRPAAPLILDGTGTLDLVVSAAGNAKGGTVLLWIQQQS